MLELEDAREGTELLRERLVAHPIYRRLDDPARVRRFMESHVFAVWDFMSLLKRLQADLCPVHVPWSPPPNPAAARFVNEIVLAEESDLDRDGAPASHLDLYLDAMAEVGADASRFVGFSDAVREGRDVDRALVEAGVSEAVRAFVGSTLDVARHGTTTEVAAAFLFGREDPIPSMFTQFLDRVRSDGVEAPRFAYYLERHVELDGDSHGPLGRRLLDDLVGGDPDLARAAQRAAERAIAARIALWNGLMPELERVGRTGAPARS